MNLFIRNFAFTFLATLSCLSGVYAQQQYEPCQWIENRKLTELDDSEKEYGLYYLLMHVKYEYMYDPQNNALVCYLTNHYIIRANNNEALGKSNRVYIPMSNTLELMELKARAIGKNNEIIEFDHVNLKDIESDESGYKILAIEGAEVGGEIEYYYTLKVNASNFNSHVFQFGFPVRTYDYSLKCPDNLEYAFKIYNWAGAVSQKDTTDQLNLYEFKAHNIPPVFNEQFSAHENDAARLEVKLAYNSSRGNVRLFTWGDAGKRIYDNIYTLSKDEQKSVNKLVKEIGVTGNPLNSLKKAEHYIKTGYFLEAKSGDAGERVDLILKNKYANSRGFTRMFAAILDHLKIEHEIVLTSNRFEKAFDPEFDSWNYLSEYLIYLPDTRQFLSPKDAAFRLGTVPFGYYGTYGLFIRREPVQDFIYPVAYIGYIPETPHTANFDNLDIHVRFSESMDKNQIEVTRSFKGYSACYYKTGLQRLTAEDQKEMLNEIFKYLALDAEIERMDVLKGSTDYVLWDEPFVVNGVFNTGSYIESAGDVILFNAGRLIGPQSELYQDHERQLSVVNSYNRGYLRKLKVQVPGGYTIQNPDDLKISEEVKNQNNQVIYIFKSDYTLTGQTLEIEIEEYYDQLTFPLEDFELFRKVINSAADFNKIVLVLSR